MHRLHYNNKRWFYLVGTVEPPSYVYLACAGGCTQTSVFYACSLFPQRIPVLKIPLELSAKESREYKPVATIVRLTAAL